MQWAGRNFRGVHYFQCVCSCGGTTTTSLASLRTGRSKSCGCLQQETRSATGKAQKKHGCWDHPLYYTWRNMKQRCYNTKSNRYYAYGARGIKMCARWLASPQNFINGMGDKPKGYTIDRIDNNKG